MKVDGITSPQPNFGHTRIKSQSDAQLPQVQPEQDAAKMPESAPAEFEESQDNEIKGVIRNLLDGHYKGVADVRLRIVHYDQLQALQYEQQKTAIGPEISDLLTAIQAAVDNIPELNQPLETGQVLEESGQTLTVSGLYAGFSDAVNGLVEQFNSGRDQSTNDLLNGIRNTFAEFVSSLQNLLVPQAEEPPVDPEIIETLDLEESGQTSSNEEILLTETQEPILPELEDDTLPEDPVLPQDLGIPAQPDYPTLISELENLFSLQMNELTGALDSVPALPQLSEPSSNGAAYKKFLAIYNELWSIQPADAPADTLQA